MTGIKPDRPHSGRANVRYLIFYREGQPWIFKIWREAIIKLLKTITKLIVSEINAYIFSNKTILQLISQHKYSINKVIKTIAVTVTVTIIWIIMIIIQICNSTHQRQW